MIEKKKKCIGIIFGGKSNEHYVSISSAKTVFAALNSEANKERFKVKVFFINVNGVCSTAISKTDTTFTVQYLEETLAKTTMDSIKESDIVNLEPPPKPDLTFFDIFFSEAFGTQLQLLYLLNANVVEWRNE